MLQQIVDRRLSGKNKSIGNRERFLRRYRDQIRDAVRKAVSGRSIQDMEHGEDITIPRRDVSEPVFGHGRGGLRETVHPGNTEYVQGDRIARPPAGGGGGSGSGQASQDGMGEDDFVFRISRDEFMQVFFDDLALPRLVRTQLLPDAPEWKTQRAGFVSSGNPASLHVVRSVRTALARRIAMGSAVRRQLREAQAALALSETVAGSRAETAEGTNLEPAGPELILLKERTEVLKRRLRQIPFLDPLDLRFRNRVRVPQPSAKAAMFCLMDVSGSMDEGRKDIAKRFFILLHLFLRRHYEKTEVIFIRHHTQASEVTEEEFFRATETGGTVVSSALTLMHQIIEKRYPPGDWNIFGAQASDGDNWYQDSARCSDLLQHKLLPLVRYFAYVQVAGDEQNLWEEYSRVQTEEPSFAMRKITTPADIYPVFRELFKQTVTP